MLANCKSIQTYYMVDPWRKLPKWNKPFNIQDERFEEVYNEARERTEFAGRQRVILRGTLMEVADELATESLDIAYIDGDHTLRGITLDLLTIWGKIRPGGYVGGVDLALNIWQHGPAHEPTLVFPMVVYFAEAMRAPIYALPFQQFLIEKPSAGIDSFAFIDLIEMYDDASLRTKMITSPFRQLARQLLPGPVKRALARWIRGTH
jgi:hypothetical protein